MGRSRVGGVGGRMPFVQSLFSRLVSDEITLFFLSFSFLLSFLGFCNFVVWRAEVRVP